MYKINSNILVESTSDNDIVMYNQENKNTIVLNHTAKMLYQSFLDNDYTTGLDSYLKNAVELFNVEKSELEEDAKSTLKYLLQENILIEEN